MPPFPKRVIKLQNIDVNKIAKIEATMQSTIITLYNGDYAQVQKPLTEVISELGEKVL